VLNSSIAGGLPKLPAPPAIFYFFLNNQFFF